MGSTTSTAHGQSVRSYKPRHDAFPYGPKDFKRDDESPDTDFYTSPRFVTHIDDNAIGLLKGYYDQALPRSGRILDFCSSWISHFPKELEALAVASKEAAVIDPGRDAKPRLGDPQSTMLEVIGLGINARELSANPILKTSILQDLNSTPDIPSSVAPLNASTCVVSIDYLTKPVEVLRSLNKHTKSGGKVHLVVSNRCFPTKAVGRWLRVGEEEKLDMVGDYLWFAGWRNIEICTLNDGKGQMDIGASSGIMDWFGSGRTDPLWVVRGTKCEEQTI